MKPFVSDSLLQLWGMAYGPGSIEPKCVEFDSGQDHESASLEMFILWLQSELAYHQADKMAFDFIVECQLDYRLIIVIDTGLDVDNIGSF